MNTRQASAIAATMIAGAAAGFSGCAGTASEVICYAGSNAGSNLPVTEREGFRTLSGSGSVSRQRLEQMAIDSNYDGIPSIIHYNNFFKPWQYDNVAYCDYFWQYAKETDFYEEILAVRRSFNWKKKMEHRKGVQQLNASVEQIISSDCNFRCTLTDRSILSQFCREAVYEA